MNLSNSNSPSEKSLNFSNEKNQNSSDISSYKSSIIKNSNSNSSNNESNPKAFKISFNNENIFFPYNPYNFQKQSIIEILTALNSNKKTILYESATGTGKTQTLLTALLYQANKLNKKVLYFTRTICQMKQVLKEADKCYYKKIGVNLSSRRRLCLNKDVLKKDKDKDLNKKCRKLVSNFFDKKTKKIELEEELSPFLKFSEDFKDPQIKKIQEELSKFQICNFYEGSKYHAHSLKKEKNYNIEDFREIGKKNNHCPFYLSRNLIDKSNLIVLSYQYLLNPFNRIAIKDYIAGNYVIFDEAHNISNNLENISSQKFDFKILKFSILEKIREELNKKEEIYFLNQFEKLISQIVLVYEDWKNKFKFQQFIDGRKIKDLLCFENCNFSLLTNLGLIFRKNETIESFLLTYKYLFQIFSSEKEKLNFFYIYIEDNIMNIICLSPSVEFSNISNLGAEALILTSGNLRPFSNLEKRLDFKFDFKYFTQMDELNIRKTIKIMRLNNLFFYNDRQEIDFTYKNQNNRSVIINLLKFIMNLKNPKTGGILIFLPSYKFLNRIKSIYNFNFEFRRNNIFFEERNDIDLLKNFFRKSKSEQVILFSFPGKIF